MTIAEKISLKRQVAHFLKSGFSPRYDQHKLHFESSPLWRRLRELGTELWLDTGSMPDAEGLWTQEFSALTTNNTLLNRAIQTGCYDSLIVEIAQLLDSHPRLSDTERMLEFAFILNAWHALRLVERFEGFVSVEEHTYMADNVQMAVDYARRFFDICPERFIIKIPFTPAGLLAARKLSAESVPINHTLGFSARQNYVMAQIAKPAFVNVFLGRLNAFVADNALGSGAYVGEKATIASQAVIKVLRDTHGIPTKQIGASLRQGSQVADLAGLDVLTIPPKIAADFLKLNEDPETITDQTDDEYLPAIDEDVDAERIRLDTLWDVDAELVRCVGLLEQENLDAFSPDDLVDFFAEHGCVDIMVRWTPEESAVSAVEGKIPKLSNWHEKLLCRTIGLDSLMNLAGLNSFATDQNEIDQRVIKVLAKNRTAHA
ncbi:MAG: transaldolase family protein [Planctomycetes bacterium]|nr:transaldolase family protein [Planctomycetota bacterium]